MIWSCPAWVENVLREAAPTVSSSALVDAICDRSIAYTTERDRLGELRGNADLTARAVFFGVADAAKVMIPLAELGARGVLPASDPVRILDVGAGTGAMTFGAAAALDRPVDVVAVDRDNLALDVFERAFRAAGRGSLRIVRADVGEPRWGAQRFDLVVAGSLFNEIPDEQHAALARNLLGALDVGGAVIIIEPALRETARALHRLRDALIDAGDAHVFAPCVRRTSPCPMLADESDWCHEDRPGQLPPRAARLAEVTGLRDGGLKFSYLVLRREAAALADVPEGKRAVRVVSHVHRPKGKIEAFACGDAGRTKLRLLRRHRSDANRAFERASRGNVLIVGASDELTASEQVDRIDLAKAKS